MASNRTSRKSGGDRKHGRNKTKCERYRRLYKREQSHIRRIERHVATYKDKSQVTQEALEKYRSLLRQ